jgi:hypothetical protein
MRSQPLSIALKLALLGLALSACGGPPQAVQTDAQGVPTSAPVRLAVPRQSVYLRASFDQDPSGVLGQFVPNGTPADQLDENVAAKTRCSAHLKVVRVAASGSFDESLNASQGVSGGFGVQPVAGLPSGGLEAAYGRGSAMRVRYTLTEKMRAEIADADAFDQCCRAAPDHCSDVFVGEMFRGTGEVYQFAGSEAGVKAGAQKLRGVDAALDFKQGAAWQRVSKFEDTYFAFRTQAARLVAATSVESAEAEATCGWAEKVPTSLDGQYFVGVSAPSGSEAGARELALRDAQTQAVKYLGESTSTTTRAQGSALEGYLKDTTLLLSAASGVTQRVKAERWCKAEAQPTPEGLMYIARVLVFFPKAELEAATRDAAAAIKAKLSGDGKLTAADSAALDGAAGAK